MGKKNIEIFFIFLIVVIFNILVNTYLDLFCLVNKFDDNGNLITKYSSANNFYNKSKFHFTTRNFFFFDIPNEDMYFDLSYVYEKNSNPEYIISDGLQGFFNLNNERAVNKIKFFIQEKGSNSSVIQGEIRFFNF